MLISAAKISSAKAPADANAETQQLNLKQQQEFEDSLKRTLDQRELESSAEHERLVDRQQQEFSDPGDGSDRRGAGTPENANDIAEAALDQSAERGAHLDVEV